MIDTYINSDPYKEKHDFLAKAIEKSITLPSELRLTLEKFKRHGNADGFYLIKNLPLDENLMMTPERHSDVSNKKRTFQSESALAVIGSYLGILYGYKQESGGSYFNNIRPTRKNRSLQSSESSDVFLELHTEIAFHNVSPDYLLLYCLRGDRGNMARTGIASIRAGRSQAPSATPIY